MFCSNCGAQIDADSAFCGVCGASTADAPATSPEAPTPAPDRWPSPVLLGSLLVGLLVIGAAVWFFLDQRNGDLEAFCESFQAIQETEGPDPDDLEAGLHELQEEYRRLHDAAPPEISDDTGVVVDYVDARIAEFEEVDFELDSLESDATEEEEADFQDSNTDVESYADRECDQNSDS